MRQQAADLEKTTGKQTAAAPATAARTLSIAEASGELGIGTSTGYYLAAKGEFPVRVILIGRTKKVLRSDLDRYLAGETREAG